MAGAYLISLTHLYLGFNQIEALPEQIGNLSTLTLLHLENNKLEGVPRSFVMLDKVTELSLAHNLFLEIPKELTKLAGLVRLDLSHQGDGSLLEITRRGERGRNSTNSAPGNHWSSGK